MAARAHARTLHTCLARTPHALCTPYAPVMTQQEKQILPTLLRCQFPLRAVADVSDCSKGEAEEKPCRSIIASSLPLLTFVPFALFADPHTRLAEKF